MFRSYTMFRAFGIPVRIHGTMLVFLPILAIYSGIELHVALVILVGVFGSVLLHELGHALAALHYKVPVRQITLYPIGGVAGLASMPESPKKEFVITAAGPLVNFILAPALFGLFFLAGGPAGGTVAQILLYIAWANVVLGTFNLLPGFPMDGGRILRALLATRMPHIRATQIAVKVGQITAIGIGIWGLYHLRIMVMVLAAFIYFAAKAELMGAMIREAQRNAAGFAQGGFGSLFGAQPGTAERAEPPEPEEGETFVMDRDGTFRRRQ